MTFSGSKRNMNVVLNNYYHNSSTIFDFKMSKKDNMAVTIGCNFYDR